MLSHYLESASSFAPEIDWLIKLMIIIVGFWFVVAEVVLIGLVIRFSAQDGVRAKHIAGVNPKEKRWISYPHYAVLAFDILIIVAATKVWVNVKQSMPPPDETVKVIAQQWAWTFVHPGPDGKLDTPDDIRTIDELHVENGKTYHFELTSRDVLHSFSIPAFRLKQDAVPGRVIKGWFRTTLKGGFDIQCTEICGIGHGLMPARILIESAADHAQWLKAHTGPLAMPPTIQASNP